MPTLGDLCSTLTETRTPAALNTEYVWHFSIPAFDESGTPARVPPAAIGSSKLLITKPCILFSRLNPRIPRVWDVSALPSGHPSLASTEFVPFVIEDKSRLDCRYLYWFLQSKSFVAGARAGVRAATKSRERVEKASLFAIHVPLPALGAQRRIAAVLDKADAVRRKRRESTQLLGQLLRSAYAHIVGLESPHYRSWAEFAIADLAEQRDGAMRTGPFGSALRHSEFRDEGDVAVLGIDNVVENRFTWAERRFITRERYERDFRRYTVRPGDLLVTIMGTTGRSAVAPEELRLAISTKHLAVITLDRRVVLPEFLSHAIHTDARVLAQIQTQNRGAIMTGLNLQIIQRLRVRLPPLSEQQRFVRVVERTHALRADLVQALAAHDELADSVAQNAFQAQA